MLPEMLGLVPGTKRGKGLGVGYMPPVLNEDHLLDRCRIRSTMHTTKNDQRKCTQWR